LMNSSIIDFVFQFSLLEITIFQEGTYCLPCSSTGP